MLTEPSEPWIFLFGPTASGKTGLLVELARRGYPLEVISADAFQIYRYMDIGTAKADLPTRTILPHHLVDIRTPDQSYSVADFCTDALAAGADIRARGKIPVVSGGTAFYYKHLLLGLPQAPAVDPAVRAALEAERAESGLDSLYRELSERDPLRASQLHPNDSYRIQRALEICRTTGRPQSDFAMEGRGGLLDSGARVHILGLMRERQELRGLIRKRVEAMFAQGLEGEVAGLRAMGYGPESPGMRAIGYKEFFGTQASLDVLESIIVHTAQYAKRQMTFFRSFAETEWIDPQNTDGIVRWLDQACNR